MSQIDEILERLVLVHSWHDSDKEDTLRHAKTKLKSILLSEAVDIAYLYDDNGNKETVKAIPVEAIDKLFKEDE